MVNAKSASAARYAAYLSNAFGDITFAAFLKMTTVHRAQPLTDGYGWLRRQYPAACIPEPGTRIKAEGLTGTVLPCLRPCAYLVFEPDGQEREAFVHPMSVALLKEEASA